MPNIKSAKKRRKIGDKRKMRNKVVKSNLKSTLKKAKTALGTDAQGKQETILLAMKKLDQAVSKGILHKNCAARKKSQLAKA